MLARALVALSLAAVLVVASCKGGGGGSASSDPPQQLETTEKIVPRPTSPPASVIPKSSSAEDVSAAIEEVWRLTDLEIARVKAEAKLSAAKQAGEARADFAATVKRWTGWAMGVLLACAVGMLIASFVPFTAGFVNRRDAGIAFASVAGVSMLRYGLLRYGMLATDVALWVALGTLVVGGLAVGIPLGVSWFRRRVSKTAEALEAKGPTEVRAAAALYATAQGATTESPRDIAKRRDIFNEVVKGA